MALSKGFRAYEKNCPPVYSILVEHRSKPDTLLFESQAIAVLSQTETEAVKKQYVKIQDAYGCMGVLQINAGTSSVQYLVLITGIYSVGKIADIEIFRITQTQFVPLQYQQVNEDRAGEVKKLINSGTFYFSWGTNPTGNTFDITLCAQKCNKFRTGDTDNRFFWNRMLHIPFLRYGVDCNSWLLKVMCGSVEIRTVYAGVRQARAAIISRLSCERTGTRFNVRGVNDEGYVANFVETEQVIYLDNDVTSYLQTRGSVPLFWEQPGVQVGSHKVRFSRGFDTAKAAFDKHMTMIKARYGRQAIINLLGTSLIGSKEGEAMLSNEFQRHHKESSHNDVSHIVFDYHQECRGGNTASLAKLKARLDQCCRDFGIFFTNTSGIQREQIGTIRTNCLDCLDRTNCVQTFIGLDVLNQQIEFLSGLTDKKQSLSRFDEVFRQMWINNGNEISKIYAGTGAIQGGSKLMDGARSAARTIQNNLLDSSKQEAIDILLVGSTLSSELAERARILLPSNLLHAPTPMLRELCRRGSQYTSTSSLKIAIGTYNVNGGKHFRSVVYKDVSLSDWLLDSYDIAQEKSLVGNLRQNDSPIDIFAIGFQEIVDLNASNIVAASTDNAKAWAEELQKVLSREQPYTILTSQQLVGVCLYVFVKPESAQYIKDVAVDSVKTGLGGATGNKGAVAIRFVYKATSMCFVCAHFAAGQSQVTERNADFSEITRKLAFPMGRTLKSHDYVFWCGDFNYRIDMDKEELKEAIKNGELETVLANDQLKKEQAAGNVFNDYLEGDITFNPTYKYDLFSEDFDTSEKMRAPAYTDRVLWKRRRPVMEVEGSCNWNPGKLIHYGRAELKQSDHRPIIAILECEIAELDMERRKMVIDDVIQDMGPPDSTIVITALNANEQEGLTIFEDSIMNAIIQELSQIGEVTLVRFVDETMWVTFRDGQLALSAVAKKQVEVCGLQLNLELKTQDWPAAVKKEIDLCTSNTIPFFDTSKGDYNCLGIPTTPSRKPPGRPNLPPTRPPLPKSPVPSPKHLPKAGVIHIPHPLPVKPAENEIDTSTDPANAIYEEINEEPVREREPAPVPPQPTRAVPPIPKRVNERPSDAVPAPETTPTSSAPSLPPPTTKAPVIPPRKEPPVIPARAPPPIPARTNPN